ncbi:MAG: heme-binding protein [Alphaproteobacteria bacterium]|nr:heme-binding protein [Alphaproteobacteria bacterium]
MSRILLLRLAVVGTVSAAVPLAQAQLLTHRDLSYAMAKTIAETAIDSCGAKGYAVSAVVVDRDGEVIVALRADNAGPHTMENARRKAYTARSFRTSTADYAKRYAEGNPVVHQQVTLPNVIAIPGGLPVKLGDDVIAGVGASGSPGVDEPCVQAGLDKVADQLK